MAGTNRDLGHLIVAAVRVLSHRHSRPPSCEEVAELVDKSPESTRVAIRHLVELGALREVTDAYDSRLEVADHLKLEELDVGGGPAMKEEMKSFSARQREKQEGLKKQFAEDLEAGRSRRFSKLEEDLRSFRGGNKTSGTNIWGEPIEESEDDS